MASEGFRLPPYLQKYGYVVGVTRNCVITVSSGTEFPDFKCYVKNEILPLIGWTTPFEGGLLLGSLSPWTIGARVRPRIP